MGLFNIFLAFLQGIIEGITEWLPISSTGHMLLVNQFLNFIAPAGAPSDWVEQFNKMFIVVIQLGAIMAVVLLFWKKIFPFNFKKEKGPVVKMDIMSMWGKVLVACLPAAIIGAKFDDFFDEKFYNPPCIATALILFGIAFIIIENWNKNRKPQVQSIKELTYKYVVIIGLFQVLAAMFPGTSRSGATIVGALLIGVARPVAAEFTFYLAIPVMFGASLLKVVKYLKAGMTFGGTEIGVLVVGCVVAFVVSLFVIRFLMNYIRKHDFKIFGWYRIALGALVLLYFFVIK